MIFSASQRAGAMELAAHLLNGDENDHVTLHEIRGFLADTLEGAFREIEAISRGTRCQKFLFSLSLNPPEDADVPIGDFEAAIDEIERKMTLSKKATPRLEEAIKALHAKRGKGRAVRNLFENCVTRQSARLANIQGVGKEALILLADTDIPEPEEVGV